MKFIEQCNKNMVNEYDCFEWERFFKLLLDFERCNRLFFRIYI